MSFWPEDGEIMVDYGWNGVEQPVLAEEAAVTREMSQPDRCRRRVILPASTQSVSFSWNSYLQRIWGDNVNHDDQWGDLTHVPDNEFTLCLDGTDGGEHPRSCYNIGFDFARGWNYLFSVDYDMNGGLVFQTVGGGAPTATADCFLPRRGDEREPGHNDDRVISVIARYNDDDGWNEDDELRQINVDGLGEGGRCLTIMHPEGNSYTLQLNQTWDDDQPKDWYNIQLEFGGGGE